MKVKKGDNGNRGGKQHRPEEDSQIFPSELFITHNHSIPQISPLLRSLPSQFIERPQSIRNSSDSPLPKCHPLLYFYGTQRRGSLWVWDQTKLGIMGKRHKTVSDYLRNKIAHHA
jgi:hypothetical protein